MQTKQIIFTGLTLVLVSAWYQSPLLAKEETDSKSEKTEQKQKVDTEDKKKKIVDKDVVCRKKPAKKKKLTEHDYILGEPDKDVKFPQEAFEKAKALKKEKKLEEAEELLLNNLESARKAGRGTTKLGKYLVRLNNIMFARGKDKAALKYGEIGVKLISKDYTHAKELSGWLVNIQSYLAMSYARRGKFRKAVKQFNEAIETAESAPEGKVSASWIKSLKQQKRVAKASLKKLAE